jgi:hypothetical protein
MESRLGVTDGCERPAVAGEEVTRIVISHDASARLPISAAVQRQPHRARGSLLQRWELTTAGLTDAHRGEAETSSRAPGFGDYRGCAVVVD